MTSSACPDNYKTRSGKGQKHTVGLIYSGSYDTLISPHIPAHLSSLSVIITVFENSQDRAGSDIVYKQGRVQHKSMKVDL